MRMLRYLALVAGGFFLPLTGMSQHDPSLFMLYTVPESNLMNPAVPLPCPWYIGLPVLTSVHVNYGNSLATYNQLFKKQAGASRSIEIEPIVNRMHRREIVTAEGHVQWLAVGHRWGGNSVIFTVTEKDNLPVTLPAEGVQLLWNGNTPYEGKKAGMRGTGAFLSHYREYALTWSRHSSSGLFFGVRGKLLFGKLNLSVGRNRLNVTTDDRTFDLTFNGNFRVNSSLPVIVTTNPDGSLNTIVLDENVTPLQLIFNGRNPGFAVDGGVIIPYGDRWTFSASVLDLGFIRWRSYLNNMLGSGGFVYKGLNDLPGNGNDYLNELVNTLVDSLHISYVQKAYTTFLPSRLMAGAEYRVNDRISAGLIGEALFLKTKMVPSLTVSGQYNPIKAFTFMLSYTLQYSGFNSLGAGIVLGRDPVQFYLLTTNIPGMIKPLNTRSENIRFGFNILLGCKEKKDDTGSKGSGSAVVRARAESSNARPGKFRPSSACYSGLPVKEKAYKKKVRKRKKKK